MEVLDVTAVETKANENFHDIPFTFGRFDILQVFNLFADGLDSFWVYNMTKKINFL